MKFLYEYRTKDNVRHDGVVNAANRDAAFALLKAKGIRPGSVKEAPGFFNKLFGKGKRWIAIGVLGALCLVLGAVALFALRTMHQAPSTTSPLPRHQIYGDPALMAEMEASCYTNVFTHPGERLLARYAQPGAPVEAEKGVDASVLAACLGNPISISADDVREVAELKRIVLWMKDELRNYLSDGVGTPATYLKRLGERQRREATIYANAVSDLRNERTAERFNRINASLRAIGLRTISTPDL